jgi:hypothetical protein
VVECLPVSILRLINHEAVSENRKGLDFYETTRNKCPIFSNKLSPMKTEIRCIVPKTTSVKPCRSNYPAFDISGRVRSGRWLTYIVTKLFLKIVSCSKPRCTTITCSKRENFPYNLIFAIKFNDYSILITYNWKNETKCSQIEFIFTLILKKY